MVRKRRFARILLLVLAALLLAGYFTFSNLLFSPIEGDYEPDISTLVPENVDFFVAKAQLAEDFSEFPRLRVADEIERTRAWQRFEESGQFETLSRDLGLDRALAEIQSLDAQMRGIDPLRVFGGRDVAIAGYLKGADLSQSEWCLYGRVSWLGKLALALCKYPNLLGLPERGLQVEVQPDHLEFSGPQMPRKIHVARVHDVVIAGTSLEMIRKAVELDLRDGQGSFGLGAQYFDRIERVPRNPWRNEVELHAGFRELSKVLHWPDRWPDPGSEDVLTAFAARLFQLGSINRCAGVLGFDGGVQLRLHGNLSSELMTPVQQKIYKKRGAERSVLARDVARLARSDAAVFAVVQAQLGDLLRELLASTEQALRSNLEDLLRETGQFKPNESAQTHTERLINELDALFKDRVALILRVNDYPEIPDKDPPHDDTPVPAWTVALWSDGSDKSRARIDELHKLVTRNQRSFGISGRVAGESGVYEYTCSRGGYKTNEFWSRFVPGTGHIATAVNADLFLISNSVRMVCEVLNTRDNSRNDPNYPRLAERPDFTALVNASLDQANVFLWVDPRKLGALLSPFFARRARDEIQSQIDWKLERARVEAEVSRSDFGGKPRAQLSAEDQARMDQLVSDGLDALQSKLQTEQEPALVARYERNLTYASAVSAVVLMLALDPKAFDLSLNAYVPLGE